MVRNTQQNGIQFKYVLWDNLPSPGEVDHTTGIYDPSFRTVVCFFYVPQEPDNYKWQYCETGPKVFVFLVREDLRVQPFAGVIAKAAQSPQLFKDPEFWFALRLNPWPPAQQTGALPTKLTKRRYNGCNGAAYSKPSSTRINCLWLVIRLKKHNYISSTVACFQLSLYVLEQLQMLMNAIKISTTVNKVLAESKRKMCELSWPNITLSSF